MHRGVHTFKGDKDGWKGWYSYIEQGINQGINQGPVLPRSLTGTETIRSLPTLFWSSGFSSSRSCALTISGEISSPTFLSAKAVLVPSINFLSPRLSPRLCGFCSKKLIRKRIKQQERWEETNLRTPADGAPSPPASCSR